MAKLGILTGTTPNDGSGDTLLQGAIKINSNFNEIYSNFGDGSNLTSLVGYATEGYVDNAVADITVGIVTSGDLVGFATLGDIAGVSTFSGDYNDLINTPTIPSDTGDLTNNAGFVTTGNLSNYVQEEQIIGFVTDGYVTNALVGYATEAYVISQGYASTSYVDNQIEEYFTSNIVGYATEGYVDNAVVGFITSGALTGYATEGYVTNALVGYATEGYVDNAVVGFITSGGSAIGLTSLTGAAEGTYGNSLNTPQITIDSTGRITDIQQIGISGGGGGGGFGINVYDNGGSVGFATDIFFRNNLDAVSAGNTIYIDVTGVATEAYVTNALVGYATEGYVDNAVVGFITSGALTGYATEGYVDSAVVGFVTSGGSVEYAIVSGVATVAGIATYTSEWILGASGTDHYTFTGPGLTGAENDPDIYLVRGQKYKFNNQNSLGAHPLRIQTTPNGSTGTQYDDGVTNNNAAGQSTLEIDVQFDAPDILYYQCTVHPNMGGKIFIDNSGTSLYVDGNAGIGTTNPIAKLDVRGDVYISGVVTASSFSGNASSADYATNSGVATYAGSSGIATYATNAGIATYSDSSGIATYASSSGIATYASSSGISTEVSGGIASVTQLSVSGVSTFTGIATFTQIGISTTSPKTNFQTERYTIKTGFGTYTASAGISTDIDSFTISSNDFRTSEYTLHFEYNSNIQSQKVLVMQNGTTAYAQEYAIMYQPNQIVSVGATISGGDLKLQVTPEIGVNGLTTYRFVRGALI